MTELTANMLTAKGRYLINGSINLNLLCVESWFKLRFDAVCLKVNVKIFTD